MCAAPIITILVLLNSTHAPGTRPDAGASVSGRITASAGQLGEMIVYLEPLDPKVALPPPSEPAVISQKGAKFSPSLLIVSVGQTVDFQNDEDRPIEHNVFSRSLAKQFDLGLYRPPEGKTIVFDKPGPVKLYCSIHRYMDGLVYVCPTPFFAKVSPDGSFSIADVTPGEYRLKTWQRSARFNEQESTVRVEPGKNATLNLEMKRG